MYIIVKGGKSESPRPRTIDTMSKDQLHKRRQFIETGLKETIFSKEKMDQRDCHDETQEHKRVADYDKWKQTKMTDGTTHEKAMAEWHDLNRAFKKIGEEGRQHNTDELRYKKSIKHD